MRIRNSQLEKVENLSIREDDELFNNFLILKNLRAGQGI